MVCSLYMWAWAGGWGWTPSLSPILLRVTFLSGTSPHCSHPVLCPVSSCSLHCMGGLVSGLSFPSSVRSPQDGAEITGRPQSLALGGHLSRSPPQAPSRADVVCQWGKFTHSPMDKRSRGSCADVHSRPGSGDFPWNMELNLSIIVIINYYLSRAHWWPQRVPGLMFQ